MSQPQPHRTGGRLHWTFISVALFVGRFNLCIASVKRSCIHFVTPEKKIIPFDTYNLFYRNGLAEKLRERADSGT